jgi:hypothetical protein
MKHLRQIALLWGLAILSALNFSGCVANRAYRDKEPVLHEFAPGVETHQASLAQPTPATEAAQENRVRYSLAFVEFDDLGEMFSEQSPRRQFEATELGQTLQEIRRINSDAGQFQQAGSTDMRSYPVFVVFTHGWKNNASESSGNVWGFRSELQSLARDLAPRPVMGIYIGWRGAVTNIPVVKEFSFWNRKDTATRIPGAHLTEALRRITMEAKSNPNAKCIVVGHSFGGLVTERTITQALVESILEYDADKSTLGEEQADKRLRSRMPDLTLLLNEAGPATEAKEFLDFLTGERVDYSDEQGKPHPLVLSMTSVGDTATHIIFPVGQFIGKHGLTTRKYEDGADEFGETDQNHYFLHTTANSQKLITHVVVKESGNQECSDKFADFNLGEAKYSICRQPGLNKTPYWVLQIPTEFVPDHSTIFKPELRSLLAAFLIPPEKRIAPPEIKLRSQAKY